MRRIIVVGAGGHAQVIADIVLSRAAHGDELTLLGFVDDDPALAGRELLGAPVFGPIAMLKTIRHDAVVVGIGDNRRRAAIFDQLRAQGEVLAVLAHPRATLAADVKIGLGTVVMAGAVINTQAVIGHNTIVNTGATIDHHAHLGAHVHVAPGVHLGGTVTLGEGAFLGVGVNVIPNRAIGAWTTVGAGATVIQNLPDRVVAVGTPARVIKEQSIF